MKLSQKFATIILMVNLLATACTLFAQRKASVQFRNIIEIISPFSSLMDGPVPGIDPEYKSAQLRPWSGLGYIRYFGKRNTGLELLGYHWKWECSVNRDPFHEGAYRTDFRWNAFCLSGNYHYPLLQRSRIRLDASPGLSFIIATHTIFPRVEVPEYTWCATGYYDQYFIKYKNLGISFGSRLTWHPFWRIALSADVRYTRALLREVNYFEIPEGYERVSRNLLDLQLKLGFCF